MAGIEKVTVDKAYFDALLRRAQFYATEHNLRTANDSQVSICRVEYDSLLRKSKEYELLKHALFQGGLTSDTLDLLISGEQDNDQRRDSRVDWLSLGTPSEITPFGDGMQGHTQPTSHVKAFSFGGELLQPHENPSIGLPGGRQRPSLPTSRRPSFQRKASYGVSSYHEDGLFDDGEDFNNDDALTAPGVPYAGDGERRTIYMNGFSERTTYRDLLSIIKGGKLLSVSLRPERHALVTFHDGAAEFLAWAKRNDIYIHAKRIEVKWADRQFQLNDHVAKKVSRGATRNLVLHGAMDAGLTEQQIREDMDHIHKLVVVDITFRSGDAYVSMNSVHNALYARTCMLSRRSYRGCKIAFFRDECDVPVPERTHVPKPSITTAPSAKRQSSMINRFDLLNMDSTDRSSDEENRTPSEDGADGNYSAVDGKNGVGINLNFLDTDDF